MATETANPIKYIRKHLNQQARRTGSPLLGKDWEKHAAITDPEHHYRHMQVHEDAAEREHAAGNHAKAEKHEHWAKGHHALARNKLSHVEWRPNVQHAAVDSELVSQFASHPMVQEHPHSVFHQHDGSKHHVEFGGDEHLREKSGHGSHTDLHAAIAQASEDYHTRNKKLATAASVDQVDNFDKEDGEPRARKHLEHLINHPAVKEHIGGRVSRASHRHSATNYSGRGYHHGEHMGHSVQHHVKEDGTHSIMFSTPHGIHVHEHTDLDTAINAAHAKSKAGKHRNPTREEFASTEETAAGKQHPDTRWWNSLTLEQRRHYIKMHPDSKFNNAHHAEDHAILERDKAKDHRIAQEAKLAQAHIKHLHNNLHSNKNIANGEEIKKHLHKLGNVLHHMGERHEEGKSASAAHLKFLAKHVTPKYKAGKPHPHVASMVHSAKKQLKEAHHETKEGRVGDIAGMYAGDAADHFEIGHHISKGNHKKAVLKMDHLDSASRDEIPSRVWNHYNKDD